MGENLTDKAKEYLVKDEKILASYNGKYFATDKRILITTGDGFEDFSYKHITSVKYQKKPRKYLSILGFITLIIGLIFFFFYLFINLFMIIGVIFLILALVFKENYYIIRTSGGEDFKIPGSRPQSITEEFIKVMREHT